jgi:hypothetical protein
MSWCSMDVLYRADTLELVSFCSHCIITLAYNTFPPDSISKYTVLPSVKCAVHHNLSCSKRYCFKLWSLTSGHESAGTLLLWGCYFFLSFGTEAALCELCVAMQLTLCNTYLSHCSVKRLYRQLSRQWKTPTAFQTQPQYHRTHNKGH